MDASTPTPGPARLLLAWGAGTVALLAWGMLFWGLLYDPLGVFDELPPGVVQAAAGMKAAATPTGSYFFPWPRKHTRDRRGLAGRAPALGPSLSFATWPKGPIRNPRESSSGGRFHDAMVAGIGLLLVWRFYPRRRGDSLQLVFLAGSLATVYHHLGDPVWFHLPWHKSMLLLGYELVAWLALGASLGAVLDRRAAAGP